MCSSVRSATHGTDRLVCISCNRVLLLSIPAAPATSLVPLPRSIPLPDPLPFLLRSHKWKSQRTGSQPAAVLCQQQRRICEGAPRSLRAVACVSKIRGDPGTEDHGVVPWLPGKCDFPCGGLRLSVFYVFSLFSPRPAASTSISLLISSSCVYHVLLLRSLLCSCAANRKMHVCL